VGDAGLSSWLAAGASVLSAAATIFLVVFIWSQICANKWTWRGKERRGSDARWCARTRGEPTGADPALDSQPHYDLRHSFASLLLHEGRSVTYVARQLGHAATLTLTLNTYGHVIDELDDSPHIPAEDAIRAACSGSCVTGVSQEEAHA
jgi:integrase